MTKPRIQGGCFLVSRQLMNSGIMNKPPEYLKVWIHLLSNAYFKDKEGLKRGQGFTSLETLREVLSYKIGYRTETPSKKKVYGIIEWLRSPSEGQTKGAMIVTTKVTHGFVYTIVNYDLYQDISNYEGNNEGTTKVQRRESKGNNIKKNVKECKNENKEYQEVVNYYKDNCKSLPQAQKITDARKSSINARIKDYGIDEVFITLNKAENSNFLKKDKDKKWLNFDWVFNPNNFIKILEGKYDNKTPITQNGVTPITTPLPKREEEF